MKLYSGRVRLAGEIKNEVQKYDLTASEILILRHIHGSSENASDPVVDIKETGSVKRTDATERKRLEEIFTGFHGEPGSKLVRAVLGVPGVPLPQEYVVEDSFVAVEEEIEEDEQPEEPAKPISRTRLSLKQKVEADAKEADAA